MSKCSVYCGPPQSSDAGFHRSETSLQPSLCSALAFLYMVKIHCHLNLQPCPVPSSGVLSRSVRLGFHPKYLCKTPSFAYLMGKSLCNAASEAHIPINYRENKCLHLQSQWTSILLAPWRMPHYLPGWKEIHPMWQIRDARHSGVWWMLLKMLLLGLVWMASLLA